MGARRAWLYFESDRGGSMNVWRVWLDETSGRPRGEPQPVTNGVRPLGYGRFSRDGRRMVVMGYDATVDITVAAFDPATPDRLVPRGTLRNQAFGWCEPSPDGAWLACTSRGAQEDLVLLKPDGTDTRRLMDDDVKDRMPTWSPDSRTLGFFSTRSGRWETWTIRRMARTFARSRISTRTPPLSVGHPTDGAPWCRRSPRTPCGA